MQWIGYGAEVLKHLPARSDMKLRRDCVRVGCACAVDSAFVPMRLSPGALNSIAAWQPEYVLGDEVQHHLVRDRGDAM